MKHVKNMKLYEKDREAALYAIEQGAILLNTILSSVRRSAPPSAVRPKRSTKRAHDMRKT